jgi:hypothetical protein
VEEVVAKAADEEGDKEAEDEAAEEGRRRV